jgi:hypothetical protein
VSIFQLSLGNWWKEDEKITAILDGGYRIPTREELSVAAKNGAPGFSGQYYWSDYTDEDEYNDGRSVCNMQSGEILTVWRAPGIEPFPEISVRLRLVKK